MTLGQQQRRFVQLVAKLIEFAYASGYEFTFGEAYRSDEQAEINALGAQGRARLVTTLQAALEFSLLADKIANNAGSGVRNSLHQQRLAIDLNLFRGGVFLTEVEDYRIVGEFWKTLDPDCRWGGDFTHADADHFSLTWDGVS